MKGRLIKFQDTTTNYERRQRFKHGSKIPRRKKMDDKLIEVVARSWMVCDPNRQPCDPDAIMGQRCSGSTDGKSVCHDTPLTGKPQWKWFVPRAEATIKFLADNGYKIVKG